MAARVALVVCLALLAAGCSDSVPGGKIITPTPVTVIGKVATPWSGGVASAGAAVFSSAGCAACHTFSPAHASGTVGPSLDDLATYVKAAKQTNLSSYIYEAIISPPASYVPKGYPTTVMPTTFGSSLKPKQLADLVAFLAKGP